MEASKADGMRAEKKNIFENNFFYFFFLELFFGIFPGVVMMAPQGLPPIK